MNGTSHGPSCRFAVRWILLSAAGLAIGLAVGLGLAEPIEALVGMMLVTPVILSLAGSLFGASQWVALWRWHRAGVVWIAATTLALGIGMTLGIVAVEMAGRVITGEQVRLLSVGLLGRILGLGVVGTVTGFAVGGAQHLALRPYATATGSWMIRCAVAFGLGFPGGAVAADVLLGGLRSLPGFATFLGVTGLIVGVLTVRPAKRIALGLPLEGAV